MEAENSFHDPRPAIAARAQDALGPATATWLIKRIAARWYPRDLRHAIRFIGKITTDQPFYLYGAGSHSRAILESEHGQDLRTHLKGFLDQKATPGQTWLGLPVYPPSHALEDPHLIVLSHHEFEDSMRDDLLALGIPESRIRTVYLDEEYGGQVLAERAEQFKLEMQAKPPKEKPFAIVNSRSRRLLTGAVLNQMPGQRPEQWCQISMARSKRRPEPGLLRVFDSQNSLALCFFMLHQLKPQLIYVQEHYSSGNFLPLAIGLAYPEVKVVCEYYDWLGLTFDDPYILNRASYWRRHDVALALAAEKWCSQNLAGTVTKEDGPPLDAYLAGGRVLKYKPALEPSHFAVKKGGPNPRLRLVWAGTIAPSSLSAVMFGDNQLIDVFEQLLALDFEVTAFTTCASEAEVNDQYPDYLELAARCQNRFQIKPAMPQHQLVGHLAQNYDFGLMLGIPKPGSQQGVSHSVTVSAKFYTYLAAGLPVIVGAYLRVMADWVKNHNLGMVVDHRNIQELTEKLNPSCYPQWLAGVARYRDDHHLGHSLQAMDRFLAQISRNEPSRHG